MPTYEVTYAFVVEADSKATVVDAVEEHIAQTKGALDEPMKIERID